MSANSRSNRQARSSSTQNRVSRRGSQPLFRNEELDTQSYSHRIDIQTVSMEGKGGVLVYGYDASKANQAFSERLLISSRENSKPFFAGYPAVVSFNDGGKWGTYHYPSYAGGITGRILSELAQHNTLPEGITPEDLANLQGVYLDEEGEIDESLKDQRVVKVQTVCSIDRCYVNNKRLNRGFTKFMNGVAKQEQGYLLRYEIYFNSFYKGLKYNTEFNTYSLRLMDVSVNLVYGELPTVDLTGLDLVPATAAPADKPRVSRSALNGISSYEDFREKKSISSVPSVSTTLDIPKGDNTEAAPISLE